jgi:TolB-like protein
MKKILKILAILALPAFATHVAVLETTAAKDALSLEEKQYLTDVLRSEAVKALPAEQNYVIMTRENIIMMLPPGKTLEDCEGECLVETGKNIAADYIAQGHVGRFGDELTITVELYETSGNKLLGSFSSKAQNVATLESEIRQRSHELFLQIVASTFGTLDIQPLLNENIGSEADLVIKIDGEAIREGRKYARGTWDFAPGEHEVEFTHNCFVPQKFKVNVLSRKTVTVNASMDALMGQLSLVTDFKGSMRDVPVWVNGFVAGRTPFLGKVPVCAKIEVGEEGFRETVLTDWSSKDKLEVTHHLLKAKPTAEEIRADSIAEAKRLEEKLAAEEAAREAAERSKITRITRPVAIGLAALGVLSLGAGVYQNLELSQARSRYEDATTNDQSFYTAQWDKVKKAEKWRNIFYGVGTGLIAAGAVVFFVF